MPTIEANPQIDELLRGAARLPLPDFENFFSQVMTLRQQRLPSVRDEAILLECANKKLPPKEQRRYDKLTTQQRYGSLTPAEHQELLALVEHIEEIDFERVKAMDELARLRGVSLKTVMSQLTVSRPEHV